MASKIGKSEWTALYAIAGLIDIIQFFGDLFLTEAFFGPEITSAVADPFIGLGIGGYFQFRGVDMIRQPKRIISLVGVAGLEELTGGIAPAWIVDIWYIHKTVKQDEAAENNQKQQMSLQNSVRQPLYVNGVRRPETQTANSYSKDGSNTGTSGEGVRTSSFNVRPLNFNGVRVAVNNQPGTRTGTGVSNKTQPASINVKATAPKQINTNETLAA